MNELSLQRDLIKAVEAHGGAAHKLSSRFLVGVADLLVKVPDFPAALLEAKYQAAPIKKLIVDVDLTVLQERFLHKYTRAGMITGIVSFVSRRIEGRVPELGVKYIVAHSNYADMDVTHLLRDYCWGKVSDRPRTIWNELINFLIKEHNERTTHKAKRRGTIKPDNSHPF